MLFIFHYAIPFCQRHMADLAFSFAFELPCTYNLSAEYRILLKLVATATATLNCALQI
jgi:hypothetical protein